MRGLVWTCVLATLELGQAAARTRRQAVLSSRARQALIGHLDITSDKVTRAIYSQITYMQTSHYPTSTVCDSVGADGAAEAGHRAGAAVQEAGVPGLQLADRSPDTGGGGAGQELR